WPVPCRSGVACGPPGWIGRDGLHRYRRRGRPRLIAVATAEPVIGHDIAASGCVECAEAGRPGSRHHRDRQFSKCTSGEERTMVDRSAFGPADEVSETDLVDQTTPADYEEPDDPEVSVQDPPPEAD